jgi:hypothetical protein
MVLFVVGAVEVEVPVWFKSWCNIGHQSTFMDKITVKTVLPLLGALFESPL